MIAESWNKLKAKILKPVEVENEWNEYPPKVLRLKSTVDTREGVEITYKGKSTYGKKLKD